jgi:hypothetical protein
MEERKVRQRVEPVAAAAAAAVPAGSPLAKVLATALWSLVMSFAGSGALPGLCGASRGCYAAVQTPLFLRDMPVVIAARSDTCRTRHVARRLVHDYPAQWLPYAPGEVAGGDSSLGPHYMVVDAGVLHDEAALPQLHHLFAPSTAAARPASLPSPIALQPHTLLIRARMTRSLFALFQRSALWTSVCHLGLAIGRDDLELGPSDPFRDLSPLDDMKRLRTLELDQPLHPHHQALVRLPYQITTLVLNRVANELQWNQLDGLSKCERLIVHLPPPPSPQLFQYVTNVEHMKKLRELIYPTLTWPLPSTRQRGLVPHDAGLFGGYWGGGKKPLHRWQVVSLRALPFVPPDGVATDDWRTCGALQRLASMSKLESLSLREPPHPMVCRAIAAIASLRKLHLVFCVRPLADARALFEGLAPQLEELSFSPDPAALEQQLQLLRGMTALKRRCVGMPEEGDAFVRALDPRPPFVEIVRRPEDCSF